MAAGLLEVGWRCCLLVKVIGLEIPLELLFAIHILSNYNHEEHKGNHKEHEARNMYLVILVPLVLVTLVVYLYL